MHLRITLLIPLLLIILTLISSFLVFTVSNRTAANMIREESLARLNLDLTRLQNILYNLLTEGSGNTEDARLNISVTAMNPGMQSLLLASEDNRVLMANYYLWTGRQADQVTTFKPAIAKQVIQTNSPVSFFDDTSETVLTAYHPVILQLENGEGLPAKRLGILFTEQSIETRLKQAQYNATNQSLIFAGLMLAATFIIAFLLHCLVSKRLARLTQIAEKITSGNLDVRTGISGHDELARLGNAFDDMVTRLKKDIHRREAAENELRKLNESLEQHIEERTRELNEKKQQLFDSQAMAHQANKMTALGEMASGIAHEINSPLQSILLFTYRLKRVVSREDYSSITGTLEKIDKSVDMITNIVESLRKMSRDSTNDPFAPECINDIVNDVLALTPVRYQLNGIRFSVNFNQLNKDTTLECQRIRIGQIIVNLLNNAFDAALETEEKWIDLGINEDSNTISITVTDSGNGIAPEIRGKIFEPMFTTKDIGKGTGLGLSISSEIARQHNGSLSIDPKSMHTKFILTLPKKQEVKQD